MPLQKASVDLLNSPDKLTKVVQETNDRNEQVDTNLKKKRTEKKIADIRNRGYKESKKLVSKKRRRDEPSSSSWHESDNEIETVKPPKKVKSGLKLPLRNKSSTKETSNKTLPSDR